MEGFHADGRELPEVAQEEVGRWSCRYFMGASIRALYLYEYEYVISPTFRLRIMWHAFHSKLSKI